MVKQLLKNLVAVLAIAATAIGPALGQNSTLLTTITEEAEHWSIPAGASVGADATNNMFANTGGTFIGALQPGTTYYIASAPAPAPANYLCFHNGCCRYDLDFWFQEV